MLAPDYSNMHEWDAYQYQLQVEYRQCLEEGLDIEKLKALFDAVSAQEPSEEKERLSNVLFDMIQKLPLKAGWSFDEPNQLQDILRQEIPAESFVSLNKEQLSNKLTGAWSGRIVGCILGKPFECKHPEQYVPFLKKTDNYPIHRFVSSSDLSDSDSLPFEKETVKGWLPDTIGYAVSDDDTNYTVLAQKIIDDYGPDFTPTDVGNSWISNQSKYAYCTAERVAYRNMQNGFVPPLTASYKNPYREWIGAQIRADYYGYINPGNPQKATRMAYRDASISHIRNGIYGAMFIAALTSLAFEPISIQEMISGALQYIPVSSRLYSSVSHIMENYAGSMSLNQCMADIHSRFDEYDSYDWCYVVPNAEIVVMSLLYSEDDFTRGIGIAVETGFDTDCNGATVGSVLGIRLGIQGIDPSWLAPLHNTLDTSIFGVGKITITDLVKKTIQHIEQIQE